MMTILLIVGWFATLALSYLGTELVLKYSKNL
jgi:hypothetical protein